MSQQYMQQKEPPSPHLQLGELQLVYRDKSGKTGAPPKFADTLPEFLILIVVVLFGAAVCHTTVLGGIIFIVLGIVLALVVAYARDKTSRTIFLLYEKGIVEKCREDTRTLRWEDIYVLQHEILTGHTSTYPSYPYTYDSYTLQGRVKIVFDGSFLQHEDLFRRISQQVTPLLLKQARQRLAARQEVLFGKITVSAAGIVHQENGSERFLPWSEVEATLVNSKGQTVMKRRGHWQSWFEGFIPNTDVFHMLVKEWQEHASSHALAGAYEVPSAPLPASLPAGFLLQGRYEVIKRLGEGGFGQVYRAYDLARHRQFVAIKQITIGQLHAQEAIEATESYHRELAHLSQLQHANLPRMYDHFSDQTHWYLVMEYIDGETLEESLDGGQPLPVSEVLTIGTTLCSVLGYLHEQEPPIIFRDLKPANIMQSWAGQLYLIDFGIARRYDREQTRETRPLGTPGYAAPEQYGKAQPTIQTDIYGLGATLLHLLTAKEPLDGQHKWEELALPDELRALLQQMLAHNPDERPRTVEEVKEHLLRLNSGRR